MRKIITNWKNGSERELMVAYYNMNHNETIRYTFFKGVVAKSMAIWEFGKEIIYEAD